MLEQLMKEEKGYENTSMAYIFSKVRVWNQSIPSLIITESKILLQEEMLNNEFHDL